MAKKVRIKLKAYDHRILDTACTKIVEIPAHSIYSFNYKLNDLSTYCTDETYNVIEIAYLFKIGNIYQNYLKKHLESALYL